MKFCLQAWDKILSWFQDRRKHEFTGIACIQKYKKPVSVKRALR